MNALHPTLYAPRSTFYISRLVIPALLLAAPGLRLWNLSAPLWYDEAFSAWLAGIPMENLIDATLGDVHPPTYYILLWVIGKGLGYSEIALRLPSVLAGMILIYVVHDLGQALKLNQKAVWLATGIMAFSPFAIYYSQEARMYALLMLATALTALGLIRQRWDMAIIGSIAAMYLHNMAILFVAGVWLASFVYHAPRNTQHTTRFTFHAVITGSFSLPALFFTFCQAGQLHGGYWIPPTTAGRILATLDDLVWKVPNNPFVMATGLITSLGLILIAVDLVRRWGRLEANTKFLTIATTMPMALVVLVSLIWQPILISRVMAPIAPFYYLWLAQSVIRSHRRTIAWLTLAIPTVALILTGPAYLPKIGRQDSGDDLLNFYGQYQPGDGLYHANNGSYVVWHYYRPDIPQYVWPQETSLAQSLTNQTRIAMQMNEANFEDVACEAKRWWLIYFHNPTTVPEEMVYIDHILKDYPSEKIKMLRSDPACEGWLVKIEPDCGGNQ